MAEPDGISSRGHNTHKQPYTGPYKQPYVQGVTLLGAKPYKPHKVPNTALYT
jgi:hypothetical protein